jgi:hypothetical protein
VFQPKFIVPNSEIEKHAIRFGYFLRKRRYEISDLFASYFHDLHDSQSQLLKRLHWKSNLHLTRVCDDEYFLKFIPSSIDQIEFILSPEIDQLLVKKQLLDWLSKSNRHYPLLGINSLCFPITLWLSKFIYLPMNILFWYNAFRLMSHFRSITGSTTLSNLYDSKKLIFKLDPSLNGLKGDLDDDKVLELEKSFKFPELARTYRRVRWQYLMLEPNQIKSTNNNMNNQDDSIISSQGK